MLGVVTKLYGDCREAVLEPDLGATELRARGRLVAVPYRLVGYIYPRGTMGLDHQSGWKT